MTPRKFAAVAATALLAACGTLKMPQGTPVTVDTPVAVETRTNEYLDRMRASGWRAWSAWASREPMKPPPPVMRIFMVISFRPRFRGRPRT